MRALKIAAHYGGRRLKLPTLDRLSIKSSIAQLIGIEAAEALVAAAGGIMFEIPPGIYGSSAVRRELGMKMLREGHRPAYVSRVLKISRSVAFEWLRKIRKEQK